MTVEQTDVIDIATIDHATGDVLLTISDHLPWDVDEGEHLLLLQDKINTYLRFIESGELFETVPLSKGRKPVINVLALYPLSARAAKMVQSACGIVESAGYGFQHRVAPRE